MGLVNNEITRFQGGLNNRDTNSIAASLKQPDPSLYHNYYEDFDRFALAEWAVVNPNGGAGTGALNASAEGGRININSDAGLGNDAGLQKLGRGFSLEASRPLLFKSQLQLDVVNTSRIAIGLQEPTNGEPEDPGAGAWILSSPGNDNLQFVTAAAPGEGVTGPVVGTIADATDFEASFYWDGIDRIYYGLNGVATGFVTQDATFPIGVILTPVVFVSNGTVAANRVLQCDYILCAKERG
jgi:hypothetical protein